ncbi:unnamed protein product [Closterium sp. Naga37s-1]|nr:unnamed protein product [Closterium sp. Naga37s-1]
MAVAAPRGAPLTAETGLAHRHRCRSPPVSRVALSSGPPGTSSSRLLSRRPRLCLAAARALPAAAPAEEATRLCGESAQGREPEIIARVAVALPAARAAGAHDDGGSEGAQPPSSAAPLLPPAFFSALLSLALPPSAIALTFSALTPPAVAASLLAPLPAPLAASAVVALPLPALPLAALDLSAAWDAVDDALFAAAHLSDRLSAKPRALIATDAACFALGLAATRAAMGVAAALAGRAYGQAAGGGAGGVVAGVLPVVAGGVAVAMGLNLLGLLPLRLPSAFGGFDAKQAAARLPSAVQMLLAGGAFAFVASPCATPVLASLLAYVASTGDAVLGGALLLVYTLGFVSPLMLAAAFTGALKRLLALRQHALWINPASGALLLATGTYALLDHTFPDASSLPFTSL